MHTWNLSRHNDADLTFEGEHLITMDDREWLGVTPNWWELSLYRTVDGDMVLGSVYYQSFPYRRTMRGALRLHTLEDVAHHLRERCGAPDMIIDALLAGVRRRLAYPPISESSGVRRHVNKKLVRMNRQLAASQPCFMPA